MVQKIFAVDIEKTTNYKAKKFQTKIKKLQTARIFCFVKFESCSLFGIL